MNYNQINIGEFLQLDKFQEDMNLHEVKINLDNFLYIRRTGLQQEDLFVRNVGKDLIAEVTEYLIENYPKELQASFGNPEKQAILRKIIAEYIPRNTNRPTKGFTLDELTQELVNSISGLDKFDAILSEQNGDITDIGFNGTDIWIRDNKKGVYKSHHRITADAVEEIVKKIAYTTGKTWNYAEPDLDTELPNLRINAMHKDISRYGTTLAIRVHSEELRISEESFVRETGSIEMLNFLKALVRSGANIMIVGETGTGKTELLKFMVGFIQNEKAINMLEDTLEANLKKLYPEKNIWNWITRISEADSDNNITFSRLNRSSVRINPEWIITSETRGGEAYDVLKSGSSGHSIMVTGHAPSADRAVERFILMSQEQVDFRTEVLGKLVTNTFNICIHLDIDETTSENDENKVIRPIARIEEFIAYENDMAITVPIFDNEIIGVQRTINNEGEVVFIPKKQHRQKNPISEALANKMLNKGTLNESHLSLLPEDWAKEKGLLNEVFA